MRTLRMRNLMVNKIIVSFLIFNMISILCFISFVYVRDENKSVEYAKESTQEIVNEKSRLVNIAFERIEAQMENMGIWIDKIIQNTYPKDLKSDYVYDLNGNLVRKQNLQLDNIEQSNILIPNNVEMTAEVIESVNFTEEFDEVFCNILKNEEITWAYVTTSENLLRCSPYMDLRNQFTNHNQRADIFYTCANEENNPEREITWSEPYKDYLGTGWTITCSRPIYKNDEFFGVISLDIAIKNLEKKYFEGFSLGEKGNCYWINEKGDLIYSAGDTDDRVGAGEPYERNIFEDADISNEKKSALESAITDKKGVRTFREHGSKKMLIYSPIQKLNSVLIVEIDTEEFRKGIHIDFEYGIFIALMELVMVVFLGVLLRYKFSLPMKNLVKCATRIEHGDYSYIQDNYDKNNDYYEIKQLNKAFQAMNRSLEEYAGKVREKNEDILTIMKTIEGTLVAADTNGKILLQSKEQIIITTEDICNAVSYIKKHKTAYSEEKILGTEIYKNIYYPSVTEKGEIDKIIIYSECITDNLLMEKAIQQLEKMAGVGQLSAAIVHELKNILARIDGAIYVLSMKDVSSSFKKEETIIRQSVIEAENVITTLLDFSKKKADGKEMIHIKTMVNQIVLLSNKELIEKNIKVKSNIDENLYWLSGYREALKVILQNLINNAIQAIEADGEVYIEGYEENQKVIIKVADNGCGIKSEDKDKIFNAFMTTKETGTGIGLWIVKRLIDSCDGRIEVNGRECGGTEFVIFLPESEEESNEKANYINSR